MSEPTTKPLRTWRPMVAWTASILLAVGLGWFAATVIAPALRGRGAGYPPEIVPPPVPPLLSDPGIPELTRIDSEAVVESSDGGLTVWNYNSGQGGTMPDIINTLRWYDGDRRRDWTRESHNGGLGWVESVATFKESKDKDAVYVVVAEQKLTTHCFATRLTAFRIGKGLSKLQEVPGFFPAMPGVSKDAASVDWQYYRMRGDVFPRPVEVRLDEDRQRLRVWLFPEACIGSRQVPGKAKQQEFALAIEKGRLVCQGLDATGMEALGAVTGLAPPEKTGR